MEIVVGTRNKGKVREYAELLADAPVTLLSLTDVDLGDMDVAETGDTFEANARLKASAYASACGLPVLADDSGLCVDVLDGAPGLYSARYAGAGATDADRRQKLLNELKEVPDDKRTARFECVIALANPQTGEVTTVSGTCEGVIAHQESGGEHGFGYDPIFIPDGYDVTFADIGGAEKNRISHRGRAAAQLLPVLKSLA